MPLSLILSLLNFYHPEPFIDRLLYVYRPDVSANQPQNRPTNLLDNIRSIENDVMAGDYQGTNHVLRRRAEQSNKEKQLDTSYLDNSICISSDTCSSWSRSSITTTNSGVKMLKHYFEQASVKTMDRSWFQLPVFQSLIMNRCWKSTGSRQHATSSVKC
jgi:hypothetical protein